MNNYTKEEEKKIKEFGAILPNRVKHKSGKFSVLVSDQMRRDFGELYLKDLKERLKQK